MMSKKLIVLCVCLMGLVYIFMVVQVLEEAAVEVGYEVKIEIQGVDGIQNCLMVQDIVEVIIIIYFVVVILEDNECFELCDVYEIILQDVIKNVVGIIKEIEEMIVFE